MTTTANTTTNPAEPAPAGTSDLDYTPKQIVSELDRFIIGQSQAKRSVAIALRSRRRRLQVPGHLQEEITPKNILMIGPTGCGKTEIARRLAKLTNSPFVRVEATTFTEVGYVGRDVESIIRDLLDVSINMVNRERREAVKEAVSKNAEERLLSLLMPTYGKRLGGDPLEAPATDDPADPPKESLRRRLRDGKLDNATVEIVVDVKPQLPLAFSATNIEDVEKHFSDALSQFMPKKSARKRVTVAEALKIFENEEADKLLETVPVTDEAVRRCERQGIVFIDEIDKVISRGSQSNGQVSDEGVQRDLLPIVEGTVVNTRAGGPIKTDHILFICAGSFHGSSPSDLIPEFQGRFPIRVELSPLSKDDFVRILTEPTNSLIRQYQALLSTEGVSVEFTGPAIEEMASIAHSVNETNENIGARRLYTIMERLLEEISFEAPDIAPTKVVVTPEYVRERLADVVESEDLRKFIL
jgi:ATP-dependent HslUV protease ATP-binding subunit HslU